MSEIRWELPERLREYDFLEGDSEFLRKSVFVSEARYLACGSLNSTPRSSFRRCERSRSIRSDAHLIQRMLRADIMQGGPLHPVAQRLNDGVILEGDQVQSRLIVAAGRGAGGA